MLNIWGLRRGEVEFPAQARLVRYLPYKSEEIETYAQFLYELGLDIGDYEEDERYGLPFELVTGAFDRLSGCVLAEPPSTSQGSGPEPPLACSSEQNAAGHYVMRSVSIRNQSLWL